MSLAGTRPNLAWLTLGAVSRGISALRGWRRAAFSFALGVASVGAFAPFHLWPLLFVTLPALVWLLDGIAADSVASQTLDSGRQVASVWKDATPAKESLGLRADAEGAKRQSRNASASHTRSAAWRQAALTGWTFGFGFFVAGLYWIGFAFLVEAEKFAWLMPLAVAALPASLALFYALAVWIAALLWRPGAARIFILAAALFGAEWLRGHILTGFPWNLWGYALAGNGALAQTASIFGIHGLTLLTLLIAASPAALAGRVAREGARTGRFRRSASCSSRRAGCGARSV